VSRDEALAKLISMCHHCFVRGVLGRRSGDRKHDIPPQDDFRQAFRTMNRLYMEAKREALKGQRDISKPPATRRRRAA
jgi:hypothetical protein